MTRTAGLRAPSEGRIRRGRAPAAALWVVALVAATVLVTPAAFATQSSVRCGATITSDVTLTKDLRCSGDGLVVARDHIHVDLGGHRIYGTTQGIGVLLEDRQGVRVTHGSIRGFGRAIRVDGGSANTISRLHLSGQSALGLLLLDTSHNLVVDNEISDIGDGQGSGIQLFDADYNQVWSNSVRGAGDGISLDGSSHNRVESNLSSQNGAGIGLFDSSLSNLVRWNRTDSNDDTGVLLDGGDDGNVLSHNSASENSFAGIGVGHSNHVRVVENRTSNNLGSGIDVENAEGTSVIGNVANRNGFTPPGCTPDCPLLDDGIHVTDTAASTTLARNTADYNSDLGIDAPTGVTDGGHNSARHNGDPAQCRPVHCG